MKLFLTSLLLIFICVSKAYAYPESQMNDCVSSALSNPATKTISKSSITKYCDCALIAIIDEEKDIRESGYKCAQENFK